MTLTTILRDNNMETKKIDAEVLKARIEAMEQSPLPMIKKTAEVMKKVLILFKKVEE